MHRARDDCFLLPPPAGCDHPAGAPSVTIDYLERWQSQASKRASTEAGSQARPLLQVHDELVLEVPEAELAATARLVRRVMEGAYQLAIPLSTEARWGKNWGEMKVLEG